MKLSDSQIRSLPLEERQKLVLDLSKIESDEKAFPNAQILIEKLKKSKGYEEPRTIKVKALEDVAVDGKQVKKDQETEIFVWQFHALARFFELLDEKFAKELDASSIKNQKARSAAESSGRSESADIEAIATKIGSAIGASIVEALKAGKALPLLLLLGLLFFGAATQAQQAGHVFLLQTNDMSVQPYPGAPYNSSGANTNFLNGTSGIMAIAGQGVTNLYTPVPNAAKYRFLSVSFWCNQMSGTAADVSKVHLDWSPDADIANTNWFNLADISATAPGSTAKYGGYTNLDLPSVLWVRASYITNAAATIMTNIILEVTWKPSQYGQ